MRFARRPDVGTRTVSLLDYDQPGRRGAPVLVTVTVSGACPRCGRPRGIPETMPITVAPDRRTRYPVSRWSNPCGHIDLHRDVLAEAAEAAAALEEKKTA